MLGQLELPLKVFDLLLETLDPFEVVRVGIRGARWVPPLITALLLQRLLHLLNLHDLLFDQLVQLLFHLFRKFFSILLCLLVQRRLTLLHLPFNLFESSLVIIVQA